MQRTIIESDRQESQIFLYPSGILACNLLGSKGDELLSQSVKKRHLTSSYNSNFFIIFERLCTALHVYDHLNIMKISYTTYFAG